MKLLLQFPSSAVFRQICENSVSHIPKSPASSKFSDESHFAGSTPFSDTVQDCISNQNSLINHLNLSLFCNVNLPLSKSPFSAILDLDAARNSCGRVRNSLLPPLRDFASTWRRAVGSGGGWIVFVGQYTRRTLEIYDMMQCS